MCETSDTYINPNLYCCELFISLLPCTGERKEDLYCNHIIDKSMDMRSMQNSQAGGLMSFLYESPTFSWLSQFVLKSFIDSVTGNSCVDPLAFYIYAGATRSWVRVWDCTSNRFLSAADSLKLFAISTPKVDREKWWDSVELWIFAWKSFCSTIHSVCLSNLSGLCLTIHILLYIWNSKSQT